MKLELSELFECYEFMPVIDSSLRSKLKLENKIVETPNEVVFFGGTFNPWHQGHTACVELLGPEKFLLICPDKNPHKEDIQKEYSDLENLYFTLLSTIKRPLHFYPGFWIMKERNPTINWISAIHKTHPSLKKSLLLGFDSLQNFHKWTRVQELAPMLHKIYIASRLETDHDVQQVLIDLKKENINVKIEFLGHHDFEHLSSTELRK